MSLSKFLSRKNIDFTRGNNISNLVTFALPIMLGALLQNLYHSADSIVLGNFVSSEALAATTICSSFTNCLVGFCTGMSVGSTVVVAKAFGANDIDRLKKNIKVTYTFSIILGIFISCLGIVCMPLLLKISNIDDSLIGYARTYLSICIVGLAFTIIYNNTAGILRAMGDMTSPFIILAITCTLNIGLDLLFTITFGLGVAGVAWATVICQCLSVIIGHYILKIKKGYRCIDFNETMKKGWPVIKETARVGVSAGIQTSMISFSNIFVYRYINAFSAVTVAGVGVGHRIDNLMSLPTTGFESAVTTFTSQNIGAKQNDRIKSGIKDGLLLSTGITIFLEILIYPLAPYISRIYSNDPQVINIAARMVRLIMPVWFTNTIRQVSAGILRAYKFSTQSMILALAGMVGVRQVFLALTALKGQTVTDLYLSYPVGWVTAMIFTTIYFIIKSKKFLNQKYLEEV